MSLAARLPLDRLTPSGLWESMDAELRRLAALAVFDKRWDEPKLRAELTHAIAGALKFRPAMIQKLPLDKRAAYAVRALHPDDGLAADLLIALHLGYRRPMLSVFLDHLGIPHQDGLIEEGHRPDPPDPGRLREAVERIDAGFPAPDVELYLLSLVAMDPETWEAVRPLLDRRAGGRLSPSR